MRRGPVGEDGEAARDHRHNEGAKRMAKIKPALLAAMCAVSGAAHASEMGALAYMLGFQLIYLAWPLVLPAFFIRGYTPVPRSYAILVGLVYAVIGCVHLPFSIVAMAQTWLEVPFLGMVLLFGEQLVALVLSVIAIRRYGKALVGALLAPRGPG